MSQPAGSGRAREAGAAFQAGLAEELAARGIVLGRRLGEGSVGATWRAHEADPRGSGRAVAVKRVGGLGRSAGRLARRLESACQLREPHLLHFLSAFSVRGSVVVVSPLDEGVPLSRLAAGRKLPRACVLAVGLGVLNALTSLHQAGLWHGALHPGNVHVGKNGSVRLGHFALTPAFPEQSPGALRTADVRAAGALL
ncbi:MAG: protein kinase, partial [Candidatus Dormibacterales bacterium]